PQINCRRELPGLQINHINCTSVCPRPSDTGISVNRHICKSPVFRNHHFVTVHSNHYLRELPPRIRIDNKYGMLLLIRHHQQVFSCGIGIRIAKHPGTPERQRNSDQHHPREHKAPQQILSLQSSHFSLPDKQGICLLFNPLLPPLSTRSPCSLSQRLF